MPHINICNFISSCEISSPVRYKTCLMHLDLIERPKPDGMKFMRLKSCLAKIGRKIALHQSAEGLHIYSVLFSSVTDKSRITLLIRTILSGLHNPSTFVADYIYCVLWLFCQYMKRLEVALMWARVFQFHILPTYWHWHVMMAQIPVHIPHK